MSSESGSSQAKFPSSMTVSEVSDVARELSGWVGSQLQEVVVDGIRGEEPRSLRLGFFWTGGIRWIVFDYRVQAPLLLLFDGHDGVPMTPPKTAGKVRRPIELFLRSKHIGRRLREARLRVDDGRALDLIFDPNIDGTIVSIELKIYPHGRNAKAISGATSVTEFKPIGEAGWAEAGTSVKTKTFDELARPVRTRSELALAWMNTVKPRNQTRGAGSSPTSGANTIKSPLEKSLEKKLKALAKVRDEISKKEDSPARQIGEWLKENQTTDVPRDWPEEWRDLVDVKRALAVNIERLFSFAKSQSRKLDGTRARAVELEKEADALSRKVVRGELRDESSSQSHDRAHRRVDGSGQKDLFVAADARGRKFQLADDLIVYLGKNAAENLAILRKAQPFDYWVHLRDRPGAHAILRRARGRNVTDAEFMKAGAYVAEQSLKRRANELKGESFDLLIVECRFVRPIKGDKLGRVNYTNDRVLRFSL